MRRKTARESVNPVDLTVGKRLAQARKSLSIERAELAAYVGVSEAEYAAFEAGRRRVGSDRLYLLSGRLKRHIAWFFIPVSASEATLPPPHETQADSDVDLSENRQPSVWLQ